MIVEVSSSLKELLDQGPESKVDVDRNERKDLAGVEVAKVQNFG